MPLGNQRRRGAHLPPAHQATEFVLHNRKITGGAPPQQTPEHRAKALIFSCRPGARIIPHSHRFGTAGAALGAGRRRAMSIPRCHQPTACKVFPPAVTGLASTKAKAMTQGTEPRLTQL